MLHRIPVGLVAAPALLALAAGLASCQETEEDTSQVGTGSPAASANAAPSPVAGTSSASRPATVPPGYTLYRWVNLTVVIPDGSGITAGPADPSKFDIFKGDPQDSRIFSQVVVDAETGEIIEEHILDQHRTEMDQVLATMRVSPFDLAAAAWPYSGEPTDDLKRENAGGISFMRPSPATGLYVGGGLRDPGAFFITLENGRSSAFVGPDPITGIFSFDTSAVLPDDLPVFGRWLATVKQCGLEIEC